MENVLHVLEFYQCIFETLSNLFYVENLDVNETFWNETWIQTEKIYIVIGLIGLHCWHKQEKIKITLMI